MTYVEWVLFAGFVATGYVLVKIENAILEQLKVSVQIRELLTTQVVNTELILRRTQEITKLVTENNSN